MLRVLVATIFIAITTVVGCVTTGAARASPTVVVIYTALEIVDGDPVLFPGNNPAPYDAPPLSFDDSAKCEEYVKATNSPLESSGKKWRFKCFEFRAFLPDTVPLPRQRPEIYTELRAAVTYPDGQRDAMGHRGSNEHSEGAYPTEASCIAKVHQMDADYRRDGLWINRWDCETFADGRSTATVSGTFTPPAPKPPPSGALKP